MLHDDAIVFIEVGKADTLWVIALQGRLRNASRTGMAQGLA